MLLFGEGMTRMEGGPKAEVAGRLREGENYNAMGAPLKLSRHGRNKPNFVNVAKSATIL